MTSKTHPATISRRQFCRRAALATAAANLVAGAAAQEAAPGSPTAPTASEPKFGLKYAPHFGMFEAHAGKDFIDQIRFMADQGFTALEDNGLMGRPIDLQEKIGRELERLGMTMGVFVSYADFKEPSFANPTPESRAAVTAKIRAALDTAARVNAKWTTVVPGAFVNHLEWDYQTANVINLLRECAEICEPSGLIMVLEPLNPWQNHPGCFLTRIPQAFQICQAVNSPYCKILDDLYHQQITEGNLLPNMERAWGEISYIQVGDHPGRKEPYTGEINFQKLFAWLKEKGYHGVVGMEHGNSLKGIEGERRLIKAYRLADGPSPL